MHTATPRALRGLVALLGNRAGRAVLAEARRLGVGVKDILNNPNGGNRSWPRKDTWKTGKGA